MRLIDADVLLEYLQIIPIDLGYREVEEIEEYVKGMPTVHLPMIFAVGRKGEPMSKDTIYRQDAIDEIEYELEMINSALDSTTLDFNARERLRQRRGEAREILNSIQQLPSAQRKKGKWIYGEDEYDIDGYRCDKCGFFVPWDYVHKFINYIEDYNYCPNCGADMRGE